MKSKFGFIPIVLPVLVMVLIIGLINLGNAPWVQAHQDEANDPKHTHNIPTEGHPTLSDLVVADTTTATGGNNLIGTQANGVLVPSFNSTVSEYKLSATYNVEGIRVSATANNVTTDPNAHTPEVVIKIKKPNVSVIERRGTGTDAIIATTSIPVGTTNIEVLVTDRDSARSQTTKYTIALTREDPQFNQLTLHKGDVTGTGVDRAGVLGDNNRLVDPTAPIAAGNDILSGANLLKGNNAELRDGKVDVEVKYHVDKIGFELVVPEGLRGAAANTPDDDDVRVTFDNISGDLVDTTTGGTYEVKGHPLIVGSNRIEITVASKSDEDDYESYRILIYRAKPQLESVSVDGTKVTSFTATSTAGKELKDYTKITNSQSYTVSKVEVSGSGGKKVEVKYRRDSSEGSKDKPDLNLGSYNDMNLSPGDNTLKITAYDEENKGYETEYTLVITRGVTPLGGLALTADSSNPGVVDKPLTLYLKAEDAANPTSTSPKGFRSAHTEYHASVDYHYSEVDVTATAATTSAETQITYKLAISLRGNETSSTSTLNVPADPLVAKSLDGIPLREGDNKIKVTAEIDGNLNEYTVNVVRKAPVTRPSKLRLIEYTNEDGNYAFRLLDNGDEIVPEYKQSDDDTRMYTATVRSNIASVGIAADHQDAQSVIYVKGTKIPKGVQKNYVDYQKVALDVDSDGNIIDTPIEVSVALGGKTGSIQILVTRNQSGTLTFDGKMHPDSNTSDKKLVVKDGRALEHPIEMPTAQSEDGEVSYSLKVRDEDGTLVDISSLGLTYDAERRDIRGTPELPAGEFESEFLVEYKGTDPVGNMTIPLKFTLVITHEDDVPPIPSRIDDGDGPANNTLKSLSVDGEKVGGFSSDNAGPYSAKVDDAAAQTAVVKAEPHHPDAMVYLDGVALDSNYEATTRKFGVPLTIKVTYTGLKDMDYTLTINKGVLDTSTLRLMPNIGNKTYVMDEEIDALTLPEAMGGVKPYVYSLVAKVPDQPDTLSPATLTFNSKTRQLSGTPVLSDSYKTTYKVYYTVTDKDGDTAQDTFRLVICDPTNPLSGDCRSSSPDVGLSSLALSGVTLDPEFASDTMAYTASVPYETTMTTVTAMTDDVDPVMVSVSSDMDDDIANGQVDLVAGANVISVTATKEYGSLFSEIYTVTVTRDDKSNDAHLSALSVSDATLTPAFDADTAAYTASVSYNVASVTVSATANDANATVSGAGMHNLSVGDNPIAVSVLAEDGVSSMIYTITVTRELPTITATIMAFRDGSTARVTWTPSAGATLQAAAMVAVKPGVTTPTSVDDVEIDTFTYLNASGGSATTDWQIPGTVSMLDISGLDSGKTYLFAVIGWDGSAWSAWQTVVE